MRTIIYVDAFNLYYGCLKNTPYKWLDLKALFSSLLRPSNQIVAIKYFTALVKPRTSQDNSPQKQQAYIRALQAYIPEVEVYHGYYLSHNIRMANANPPPSTVEVIKTEEKGSDVNLAVQMLNDAWLDKYDCAVIVSNDSDMAESMRLIRLHHPAKILGLINPHHQTHASSGQLVRYADFIRPIRAGALGRAQLPPLIPNSTIYKPKNW